MSRHFLWILIFISCRLVGFGGCPKARSEADDSPNHPSPLVTFPSPVLLLLLLCRARYSSVIAALHSKAGSRVVLPDLPSLEVLPRGERAGLVGNAPTCLDLGSLMLSLPARPERPDFKPARVGALCICCRGRRTDANRTHKGCGVLVAGLRFLLWEAESAELSVYP